jgi:4'-phosphopantetheinyl transferase
MNPISFPLDNEVHVWTALVSEAAAQCADFDQCLSIGESYIASRFGRAADRDRYIAAHGILRVLLGRYLQQEPAELQFSANGFGKPSVLSRPGQRPLAFNLAHSGDVIVYGITSTRRVGVDIEAIRDDVDPPQIARAMFPATEQAALLRMSPPERCDAFFRIWTLKEAYAKARGEGFSFPLKNFPLITREKDVSKPQVIEDESPSSQRWTMFSLNPFSGYAGALAVSGENVVLRSYNWNPSLVFL